MQFTFTRKFQKSRFSTRFDSLLSPFELDLVTKTHWFPLNKKKSFLKTKFSCLISVCITWTDWLKTQLFWTRQQSGFGVFEKYFVFTFRQFRLLVSANRFPNGRESERFLRFSSKRNIEIGRCSSQIFEMLKFSKKKNDLSRFAKPRDACTVWSKNWKHENPLKSLWKPSWSLLDFSWFYFFHTTDRSQKWDEISIRNVKKTEVEFFRILKWKLVIFGKCRGAENKKIKKSFKILRFFNHSTSVSASHKNLDIVGGGAFS